MHRRSYHHPTRALPSGPHNPGSHVQLSTSAHHLPAGRHKRPESRQDEAQLPFSFASLSVTLQQRTAICLPRSISDFLLRYPNLSSTPPSSANHVNESVRISMADEGQSTTLTQTCQVLPFSATLRLSPQEFPGSSSHVYRLPASSSTKKPTNIAASHILSNAVELLLSEKSFPSGLPGIGTNYRNHDFGLGENDQTAMLESPARSGKDSIHQPTPKIEPCGAIYIDSASDLPGEEKNPTRQGAIYYSAKATQDKEPEAPEADIEIRAFKSSCQESIPRIESHDASYTSSSRGSISVDERLFRTDSEVYSAQRAQDEDSEIDVDIQARQMRARERVVILRGRVLRTRRLVKGRRTELRRLHENVRDAVDKLTRKINELVALDKLADISPYYETLRTAQDKLGPAEEEYDRLEIRLDEEEEDLEQEEDYFYRHNDVSSVAVPDSKLDEMISPRIQPYQPPETEFQTLSLENEMVQEYSEKIVEAGRLKEDLDELENDYYRFSGDSDFRKRHNIPLSAETAVFLADYPKMHAEILESIHNVEDDIFELRDKCLNKGLFGESDHIYEHYDALYEDVMDSVYEARDRSPLRTAAHNIRYHDRDPDFGDKKEYVNKWLLEWVQDSSIDLLMLKTSIYLEYPEHPKEGKEPNIEIWPELALRNWNNDGAGDFANEFYNANKLDRIAGSARRRHGTSTGRSGRSGLSDSLRSLDAVFGDEQRAEAIMGDETGSYASQGDDKDIIHRKRSTSI